METFATDLVQITDNLKEAYKELLICHKERDGLLQLAAKLDEIENDLNFIRSILDREKLDLKDLKQNLAPIWEFLNVPVGEKVKKRSVNFASSTAYINNVNTKVTVTSGTPSSSSSPASSITLLSEEEFEQLPKYLKGRLTAAKINSFIQDFNRFLLEKYSLLLRSNPAKLSTEGRQRFFEWKAAEVEELGGRCFLTEADFRAKSGAGQIKFDQVARNILTILRQVGRIKEVRSAGIIRYVIN